MNASEKRARLARSVAAGEIVVAPGVFDAISARLADRCGFGALYMSGYGIAASSLGLPDAGLASFGDVYDRVAVLSRSIETPLICDADTGFGGLLNVRHTVKRFEEAGCAALQIEDQTSPKRCGYTTGTQVIPVDEMMRKIEVAIEAREDENLLIIARTDARASRGLDVAIARGQAYARIGADVVFVQGPETVDEIEEIAQAVNAPLLINLGHGGKTPILEAPRLKQLGYAIAIYPGLPMLAAAATLEAVYSTLSRDGDSSKVTQPLYSLDAMHRLMGFEDVWAFEERWAGQDGQE